MAIYTLIERWGVTQKVSFTSASAAMTTAFGSQTRQIYLAPNSHCHVKIADTTTPTATSNDPLIYATKGRVVNVGPGQGLAAIRASGGTLSSADGILMVTELV